MRFIHDALKKFVCFFSFVCVYEIYVFHWILWRNSRLLVDTLTKLAFFLDLLKKLTFVSGHFEEIRIFRTLLMNFVFLSRPIRKLVIYLQCFGKINVYLAIIWRNFDKIENWTFFREVLMKFPFFSILWLNLQFVDKIRIFSQYFEKIPVFRNFLMNFGFFKQSFLTKFMQCIFKKFAFFLRSLYEISRLFPRSFNKPSVYFHDPLTKFAFFIDTLTKFTFPFSIFQRKSLFSASFLQNSHFLAGIIIKLS